MLKQTYFLFLLPLFFKSQAQTNVPKSNFGEGIVSIQQAFSAESDSAYIDSVMASEYQHSDDFVYYIKGDKILRKDSAAEDILTGPADDTANGMNGLHTSLKAALVHPHYLIDWQHKIVYTFYKKKGEPRIAKRLLKEDSSELFYRLIDENKPAKLKLSGPPAAMNIIGKKCYKGIADQNGDETIFYYTMDPFEVKSPLNGFVPAGFPYQVLRVQTKFNSKTAEGKPASSTIVFQVSNIKPCKLDDSLFSLPSNVIIRENVPYLEIYFPDIKQ